MSLAAEHLDRAREAAAREAFVEAVVWASHAAEVAVTVLAENRGIDTQKKHFRRATLARRLHEEGVLDDDLGSTLVRLNDERKHAVYDGREPDLRGRSWTDLLEALGRLVEAAAADRPPRPA